MIACEIRIERHSGHTIETAGSHARLVVYRRGLHGPIVEDAESTYPLSEEESAVRRKLQGPWDGQSRRDCLSGDWQRG